MSQASAEQLKPPCFARPPHRPRTKASPVLTTHLIYPSVPSPSRPSNLATMQGRDEDDLVPFLQLVLELPFQLPVGRIDED